MRTYKRKTQRSTTSVELLKRAADAVMKEGKKIKTVAKELEICHMTLFRFIKKLKAGQVPAVGYKPRLVFDPDHEKVMAEYLLKSASIYFGLLPEDVRKLAYECAIKLNMPNIPPSWHENKKAGPDCFTSFLKRNPSLSIQTPEPTSAGRASAFNRHNVNEFFQKLSSILVIHNLTPTRIWNLDETGVTTVLKPKKIVAPKGVKQVGAIVSAERGTLVTVELAVNAAGNTIPPMFVFPHLKYKDIFLRDGPPESIGAGNGSGWMTATEFLVYMDHFVKFTKPTPEQPVLLLLDNHSSHINIDVVEKAKANSIIMLSFPPHCTHMLQPLDVGVNGPFKTYCAKAQDNWLRNNPGKTMSIYEIPGIVKSAWPLAATPTNIMNSFKKTGIYPYNPEIFTDDDFAPSYVTDRPMPENEPQPGPTSKLSQVSEPQHTLRQPILSPSTSLQPLSPQLVSPQSTTSPQPTLPQPTQPPLAVDVATFSPEIVKPFPKAMPRLTTTSKRRIRKTAVLTDSPEKNALAEEQKNKKLKRHERLNKGNDDKHKGKGKGKGKTSSQEKRKKGAKRQVLQDEDSESEDEE